MKLRRLLRSSDFLLGAIYMGIGIVYGTAAARGLAIGSLLNMGPGYFPLMISVALVAVGAALAFKSMKPGELVNFRDLPWRGIALVCLSIVAFGVLVRGAGLVPATFVSAMFASFSTRAMSWRGAITTSAVLAAFNVAMFSYVIESPMKPFGSWFAGS